MVIFRLFSTGLLVLFCLAPCRAQTVSTLVPKGSKIDESIFLTSNGILYGAGYLSGSLYTFNGGSAVELLDSLKSPSEIVELSNGDIVIAESKGHKVTLYNPSTSLRRVLTNEIQNPAGLTNLLHSDTLLVSSTSTNSIYKVTPNGDSSLYLKNSLLNAPVSFAWDDLDNLYIANYSDGVIIKKSPNNTVTTFCTLPTSSLGHIVKIGNFIYATGVFNHKIYRVELVTGKWKIFAGSSQGSTDGTIALAQFNTPNGLAASISGDSLYISEYSTQAVRLISAISENIGIERNNNTRLISSAKIWPNPVHRDFFIELQGSEGDLSLTLYSAIGQRVDVDIDIESGARNSYSASLKENLPKGIYFLKLSNADGFLTKRILVQYD
jgi:sugar lactone lactonase YvrE